MYKYLVFLLIFVFSIDLYSSEIINLEKINSYIKISKGKKYISCDRGKTWSEFQKINHLIKITSLGTFESYDKGKTWQKRITNKEDATVPPALTPIKVYCTSNHINIELVQHKSSRYEIKLFNIMGEDVYTPNIIILKNKELVLLNKTELSSGIYIVNIIFENGEVFSSKVNVF